MSSTVTTTITELPQSRVRIEAEVAPAEVERRVQQAARKLGSSMRVPGFRKGKVPPPVIIRRLGREYVLDEALRESLGVWYADAIEASGIASVGEPGINVGELPVEGGLLSFSIEIGVRPVAQLGAYKGVEIERRQATADEQAILAELEQLRERQATLETVQRAAQHGDFVVMDYLGKLDGEPFPGGEGRDQLLELGSGRLIPGFEEQLLGAGAGEERLVEVSFPDDYGTEQLAGKPASFEVKISEVKAKNLPDLDDDFAVDAAGLDTLAELREDIARRLTEHEEHTIEHEFERGVLDAVAANAQIEVPKELAHARAHEMVEETLGQLSRQGISKEQYLEIAGQSEEEMAHEAEPEAEQSLRREAVIAAVVAAEQIEPTDEEVRVALGPTAERGKTTVEQVFKQLQSNGRLNRVRRELADRKAVELLVEQAKPLVPGKAKPAASKKAKPAVSEKAKPAAPKKAKPAPKKPAAAKRSTTARKPAESSAKAADKPS